MIVSSASAGREDGADQARAPPRQGEQPEQERERGRDRQDDLARALLLTEDRLQEREVEREEDVLDDDDPEDHPGLGIGDPAKVEDELRDDRRRRGPDHPRDDEDLARPPAERPAEHEAGAEVERDVRPARPQQTAPTAEEIVDRELDPEVKEQQNQAEHRQQVDRLRVLEHDDSRRMRTEDDPRDDEERDRRQAEAAADASEQPGEQERRSQNGELVLHSSKAGVAARRRPCAATPNRSPRLAGTAQGDGARCRWCVSSAASRLERTCSRGSASPTTPEGRRAGRCSSPSSSRAGPRRG